MFDAKRHNSSLAVFQAFTAVRFQDILHVRYQTHPRVFGNLTLNILCSLENNVVRKALEAYELIYLSESVTEISIGYFCKFPTN